jgi:hypothetical protein
MLRLLKILEATGRDREAIGNGSYQTASISRLHCAGQQEVINSMNDKIGFSTLYSSSVQKYNMSKIHP